MLTDKNIKRGQEINFLTSVKLTWLGWRDSNPRMPGPKPGALPLGDIPLVVQQVDFSLKRLFLQCVTEP